MSKNALTVVPIQAPVREIPFNLYNTIIESAIACGESLQDGDILAVSSKYVAISQGRIVYLDDVTVSTKASELAQRYNMDARIAQLVLNESDHIFGGIQLGYMLTYNEGIIAPNAGLDRSNIPSGQVVLLPEKPYQAAASIRRELRERSNLDIGVILTDSWLMPGRMGTSGVALATAGFRPIQDERGKVDLFGNPMAVTQRGIADSLCICAQMVMGERDEATPLALIRNTGVELLDVELGVEDVAIPWEMCLYIESLTTGALEHDTDKTQSNGKVKSAVDRIVPGT